MIPTLGVHKFTEEEQKQNQIYFDIIKDAIDNYEVKNFAITGAYGTGKSTIIQNFFRLYPTETEDYTHAIVSLSSFCDTSTPSAKEEVIDKSEETKTEESSPKEENKEREENKTKESRASSSTSSHKPSLAELEMSILQQLFYQIDEKKLRFSRFQRKTKISTSNKIFTFIVSLGCVITLFAFSYKDTFSKYLSAISQLFILEKEDTILFNIIKGIGLFIPALILTIGAYILFERLYYGIYKGHWKKLQFNLGKIQSEHQITGSIINDNLHDILVFFHNAELDVVVFEDIDRLDNAMEIFTKLRELNETINRSHEFQSIKKKVLFIYALKDDILPTPEARTKFFDLIMPIVPLVSSDNSYNLFSQELKEIAKKYPQKDFIPINECISDEMLYTVSPYLSDIRSIRNIVTEFYIQWKLLIEKQWGELFKEQDDNNFIDFIIDESQQLISLIIFKHFFPKDYLLAKQNKGLLYFAFNSGKNQIKARIKENNYYTNYSRLSRLIYKEEGIISQYINEHKKEDLFFILIKNEYIDENYISLLSKSVDGIYSLNDINFYRQATNKSDLNLVDLLVDNPDFILKKLIQFSSYQQDFIYNTYLMKHIINNTTIINKKLQKCETSFANSTIKRYHNIFCSSLNKIEKNLASIQKSNIEKLKLLFLSLSEEKYQKYIIALFLNKKSSLCKKKILFEFLDDLRTNKITVKLIISDICFEYIQDNTTIQYIERFNNYSSLRLDKEQERKLFDFWLKKELTLQDVIFQKKFESKKEEFPFEEVL